MNANYAARVALETERPLSSGPLDEAFARHQGELLGTLFYLVGNLEDARDALQETFIKCWKHRQEVDEVRNLRAWIFRIALNTGRDMRETAWRRKRRDLPEDGVALVSGQPAPGDRLAREEQLSAVRRAVGNLRAEEQEVFLLRQNGQLSYDEIAQTLDIPLGTVKTRMRLALTKLRQALEERD